MFRFVLIGASLAAGNILFFAADNALGDCIYNCISKVCYAYFPANGGLPECYRMIGDINCPEMYYDSVQDGRQCEGDAQGGNPTPANVMWDCVATACNTAPGGYYVGCNCGIFSVGMVFRHCCAACVPTN